MSERGYIMNSILIQKLPEKTENKELLLDIFNDVILKTKKMERIYSDCENCKEIDKKHLSHYLRVYFRRLINEYNDEDRISLVHFIYYVLFLITERENKTTEHSNS